MQLLLAMLVSSLLPDAAKKALWARRFSVAIDLVELAAADSFFPEGHEDGAAAGGHTPSWATSLADCAAKLVDTRYLPG